jgi:2'-5' RNA ligase
VTAAHQISTIVHESYLKGGAVPANRFSLWLVPDGAVDDALQAVVERLAQEHDGPSFPPHVTLLGGIVAEEPDVVERSRRLAAQTAPFTIHLDDIGVGETYFQSLFATVRPTPELLSVRRAAEQAFPESLPAQYHPHLSLLYGHTSPATKQTIVQALRGTLPPSFAARTLVLYQTGAGMADWRHALTAPLTG